MPNRTANYSAFYVKEPFSTSNLGANATKDFIYYNQLKAWKAQDSSFPFIDAHSRTYNVRDNSKWDTLKSRLHERLTISKNIILFLSSYTKNSTPLREEIDYGINTCGLPVIVIYPDFHNASDVADTNGILNQIKTLWNNLPIFRENMNKVATLHVPYKKEFITTALNNSGFKVQTMKTATQYYYPVD